MRRDGYDGLPREPALDGLIIRTAEAQDEEGLAALLTSCFEGAWTAKSVRDALTCHPQVDRVYVVTRSHEGADGNAILATASARIDPVHFPGAGYLHWVAVAPEWRGKRLGVAICLRVLNRFRELGFTSAVLETDDHRLPAIRMYLGMGFRPVYRHPADESRWLQVMNALQDRKGIG